jgi:hypothetical protein
MKLSRIFLMATALVFGLGATAQYASADEQAAIDGCIDQLRKVGGPDAEGGGEIVKKEWSQAGTMVTLRGCRRHGVGMHRL